MLSSPLLESGSVVSDSLSHILPSGVLLLDKPAGISSNGALGRIKHHLRPLLGKKFKLGHAGTLDPFATGLLPILIGQGTRFSDAMINAGKVYVATLHFGITTSTGDTEGEITDRFSHQMDLSKEVLERVILPFMGNIQQIPPMYSALKHQGKPLYDYARQGVDIPRSARPVRIDKLDWLAQEGETAVLRVACGKGVYVRTLAEDIGRALGYGAHLSALRRLQVGAFNVEGALSLEQIDQQSPEHIVRTLMLPCDQMVQHYPKVSLFAVDVPRFLEGQRIALSGAYSILSSAGTPISRDDIALSEGEGGLVRIYEQGREGSVSFLGLGSVKQQFLYPVLVLARVPLPLAGEGIKATATTHPLP